MELIALYFGICFVGAVVGTLMRKNKKNMKHSGKIQTAMLILLLFMMGARLGANEEVVKNMGTIGVSAFIFTIPVMVGSTTAIFITRKLIGFTKEGKKND